MTRRYFFLQAAVSVTPNVRGRGGARITRIRVAPLQGRFHKFVAMNAYDRAPKGHTYEHALIRIETSEGVEGLGPCSYAAPDTEYYAALRKLLGADPTAIYQMEDGRIAGRSPDYADLLRRYNHLDGALFDLLGKLTSRPVSALLGDVSRERIDVYDGTLYFSDVWFRDRGTNAVVEEVQEAVRRGYEAVKLKLGRGFKWMDKAAGLGRDIEVVRAVREAVGPAVSIMTDPNDGYRDDFDGLWRLLTETRAAKLYWIEEPFPESVAGYQKLKDKLAEAGIGTRIADGENFREPAQFDPYLKPRRLMDVLQLDIRTGGLLANREVAKAGQIAGAMTVPHNWASRLGFLMSLHTAKAVPGIPWAEDDRSTYDVVVDEGYEFSGGQYKVSSLPGLGVRIDERAYELKCKAQEVVIA